MKMNQRDENLKRSKIANKNESSGKIASLKSTIFVNKKQQKEFATTLNTNLYVGMCKRKRETAKSYDYSNCYEMI